MQEFTHRQTTFLGRNGSFKQAGIAIFGGDRSPTERDSGSLDIYPVTSKGQDGRCRISIPKESVPAFIEALKKEAGIQ